MKRKEYSRSGRDAHETEKSPLSGGKYDCQQVFRHRFRRMEQRIVYPDHHSGGRGTHPATAGMYLQAQLSIRRRMGKGCGLPFDKHHARTDGSTPAENGGSLPQGQDILHDTAVVGMFRIDQTVSIRRTDILSTDLHTDFLLFPTIAQHTAHTDTAPSSAATVVGETGGSDIRFVKPSGHDYMDNQQLF